MARSRSRKPKSPDLSMIAAELRGLAKPIDSLTPDPRNAKRHGDRNLAAIAASYRQFGQVKPVVAVAGVVIAGNGQLAAANTLGWTHLAVVEFPTQELARAYALADNRTSEIDVAWDPALLQESLAELESLDLDLAELGFSDDDLAELLPDDEPERVPPPFGDAPDSVQDNVDELDAIKKSRRAANENTANQRDTEHYLVVVYPTREAKEAALTALGFPADERYLPFDAVSLTRTESAAPLIAAKSASAKKSGATG